LAAYLLFNIGEWASWIALLVWAYGEAGVRGASVIAVVQLVPAALLASPGAAWLGRMPAPRALRLGYAAQAASAATLGTAILFDASFGIVCALAVPMTVSVAMTRPVHHTLLPEISATTGELTAANAASGWVEAAATFLGPLASGVIAAWWHPGGVLVVMAAGSAVGLLCTIGLGPGVPRVVVVAEDARPSAALRAVVRHPGARLMSGLVAAEYAMLGMLDILLVVLALDLLDMSTAGPGLLNSALGVGGLIGAGFAIVLIGAKRLSPALVVGAVATGVPFAVAGLSRSAWLAMALIAVCGAGKLFFDVASRTFTQRLLPDRLLTAVFGLQEATMSAGLAIGSVSASVLVNTAGPTASFVVAGLFMPVVALFAWPALRRLDAVATVPEDRLALVRGVPMLAVLSPRVIERIALASGRESYGDKVAVVTEGRTGDLFYVIDTGHVVVTHGEEWLRRLGPGDWFGELALLRADARRTATVTTDGPVDVVTVDRRTFLTALAGTPDSRTVAEGHARDHYR
jgi:MFS family permease